MVPETSEILVEGIHVGGHLFAWSTRINLDGSYSLTVGTNWRLDGRLDVEQIEFLNDALTQNRFATLPDVISAKNSSTSNEGLFIVAQVGEDLKEVQVVGLPGIGESVDSDRFMRIWQLVETYVPAPTDEEMEQLDALRKQDG